MKRILSTLIVAFIAVIAIRATADDNGPAITFKETKHDFGTIRASDGKVQAVYCFTNTGTEPLVIITVSNGGCGCTTPSYPMAPIAPGKSGEITVTFDPTGRRGEFNREIKVKTNASKKRTPLRFSGSIIP